MNIIHTKNSVFVSTNVEHSYCDSGLSGCVESDLWASSAHLRGNILPVPTLWVISFQASMVTQLFLIPAGLLFC